MTDETKTTRERASLPSINPDRETYMVVDRVGKTDWRRDVEGTFEEASAVADERSVAIRGERKVFIYTLCAVAESRPTVTRVGADLTELPR